MSRHAPWLVEVAQFLKLRVTAIMFGMFLVGAFMDATFIKPNLIERSILIVSAISLGWYFSARYHCLEIETGTKLISENERLQLELDKAMLRRRKTDH